MNVTISRKDFEEMKRQIADLEDRDLWLCSLEEAGVDNWEGWDMACEIYHTYKEEEED